MSRHRNGPQEMYILWQNQEYFKIKTGHMNVGAMYIYRYMLSICTKVDLHVPLFKTLIFV